MAPTIAEALLYGDQDRALITPRWKLIRDGATGACRLYDREADRGERRDLSREVDATLLASLEGQLDSLSALCPRPRESLVTIDQATRSQLESLGYLGGGG